MFGEDVGLDVDGPHLRDRVHVSQVDAVDRQLGETARSEQYPDVTAEVFLDALRGVRQYRSRWIDGTSS